MKLHKFMDILDWKTKIALYVDETSCVFIPINFRGYICI